MPITRTQVTRAVIRTAGRLNTIGIPKMCGAASKNPAVREAVRRSVRSQAGISIPKPRSSSHEVARPGDGDGDVAHRVLDDEVPADDPGDELARASRTNRCRRCPEIGTSEANSA